jgi:hypothetical protein
MMKYISVREVVLVLAIAVVSTNWAIDHYSQVTRHIEHQRELVAAQESLDKLLNSRGIDVIRDASGVHLNTH